MSWEQMGRSRGCREAQRGPKGGCSLGLATCHGEWNWVGWWPQGNGSLGPGRAPFSPSDQVGTVGRDDRIGGKRPSSATQACTAEGQWCDSGVAHILEVAPRRSTRGCEDSRAWGLGRATLSWAPAGFGQPGRGSRERVLGSNLSQKARTKGLRACRLNLPRDRRAEGRRRRPELRGPRHGDPVSFGVLKQGGRARRGGSKRSPSSWSRRPSCRPSA